MAVLQAYQADLRKDMDRPPEAVEELCCTTDLVLHATNQTAGAIGRSMAAMVATERHLWVNLADVREKDKNVLLDAPVSLSDLLRRWSESLGR